MDLSLNYHVTIIMSDVILGFITIVFHVICHYGQAKEGKIMSEKLVRFKIWELNIKNIQLSLFIKMQFTNDKTQRNPVLCYNILLINIQYML